MKKKVLIVQLHTGFEQCMQTESENGTTFWLARDLQELLGYERWENFSKVIDKARTSCNTSGYDVADHFLDSTKMVELDSGAQCEFNDVMLSRYACYRYSDFAYSVSFLTSSHQKPKVQEYI